MTRKPGETGGAATAPDWSCWTVILLKPDCLARQLTRPVLAMAGAYVRVVVQRTVCPTQEQTFGHYADILPLSAEIGVDVPAELRRIYVGHPVIVALGYGPDAATRLRSALGHRDPSEAGPDTIRGRFGTDSLSRARAQGRLIDNLIHSSDHAGDVAGDLARWFGPDFVTPPHPPAGQGDPS